MAVDFLLLRRYPGPAAARFRHYGWERPAFTFGYSQKISFVREHVAACVDTATERFELCRRPTGGGIVDHRADWTYALVIPRGHPLEALRATESYRLVHESLAGALQAQGVPAETKRREEWNVSAKELEVDDAAGRQSAAKAPPGGIGSGICFERAEACDVIDGRTGRKIAGAAQKRSKDGLLFQGSVWRPAAGGDAIGWDAFHEEFAVRLAAALELRLDPMPWPEFNEEEFGGLAEQYSSAEWLEFR
jgi:lipoyl(octanoyl) transferase